MKSKLKKWVALIGLMAVCLLMIGGTVGAAERSSPAEFATGPKLMGQQENSTSKPNDPGNSAVVDGGFLSRTKAWAKDHGLGAFYGVGVGIVVGLAVAGIAVLLVASAPVWVIVGMGALAGGLYGLLNGAAKFDIWDCVLFSAIGAISAGIGSGLPAAGLLGWIGRGAVEGIGGGLISLGSYLLHNPHPTWGGAGQAFTLGAVTALAFMGLGAGVNKLLGGRLASLGGKLRNLLPWAKGAGAAVEGTEGSLAAGGAAGRGSGAVAEGLGQAPGSALETEAAVTAERTALDRSGSGALSSAAEAPTATPHEGPATRPSWRDSEVAVGDDLTGQGYQAQQSFKDGESVRYGTRGSSRPEYFKDGWSVEVKNYDVTSAQGRSNLARNISGQARTRLFNLPPGTEQSVIIDVRGQSLSPDVLEELARRISDLSGGAIRRENIKFKW